MKTKLVMLLVAVIVAVSVRSQEYDVEAVVDTVSSKASQTLIKIADDVQSGKTPIEIYPPGLFDWLGDVANGVVLANNSQFSQQSSMAAPGPGGGPFVPPPCNCPDTNFHKYFMVELPTFGGNYTDAYGLNDYGQVVGYASYLVPSNSQIPRAFLFDGGYMQDLGTLGGSRSYGNAINSKNHVVGSAYTNNDSSYYAFLYANGSMKGLGTLGGPRSEAYSINSYDQITGGSDINFNVNSEYHAFLYSGGHMQDLGTLGGASSVGYAINDSGQVAGYSYIAGNNYYRAFLYSDGSMQDIGTLGGSHSRAFGINNAGQVVGQASVSGGDFYAFLYAGGSMINLGSLGGNQSAANSVNSHCQIVGYSTTSGGGGSRAFLYCGNTMRDLNSLLMTNINGWTLIEAKAINELGQIAGIATDQFGKQRAFLLNLVDPQWIPKVQENPSAITYGNCPAKDSTKNSLIFVTHGAIPWWENPTNSTAWVDSMTNAIRQYLTAHSITNYQVVGYKWIEKAKFAWPFGPENSLWKGEGEGRMIGSCMAAQGWSHMHLIAHSAGAGLIQNIVDIVKPSSTTVHCTFLDPFVGLILEKRVWYGNGADWSEQYFSHDLDTIGGSVVKVTESLLDHAYNVNVTQLNKVTDYGAFSYAPNGIPQECLRTVTSHGWPVDFYLNTITGNTNTNYLGFGFPLSKEGGNWNYATNHYTNGNTVARVLGTPDQDCVSFAVANTDSGSRALVSQAQAFDGGDVVRYINGLTLTSHSPSWLALFLTITNTANMVSFDAQFLSTTNSKGLLTVYWDTNVIGSLDEKAVAPGLQHHIFSFPSSLANSTHMLAFRIDPFTNAQSIILVTNIVTSMAGPSQPFNLSLTTNKVNGLRVYELMGQSGFNYTVDASTNLVDWKTVAVLVNTNGSVRFYDRNSTNFNRRYYRVSAQ